MRKTMLTVAAAFAMLVMVLLPSTASAEPSITPGGSAPATAERSTGPGDVSVAATYEVNYAVAGTLPPRSQLICASVSAVEICYEPGGDHWWVQDQASDGASAAVHWENYRSGSLYRNGLCVNSLGKDKWGQCNKNYYEDSTLYGFPCVWDRSESDYAVCNNSGWRFQ